MHLRNPLIRVITRNRIRIAGVIAVLIFCSLARLNTLADITGFSSGPPLLTYEELKALAQNSQASPALQEKMNQLFDHPFLYTDPVAQPSQKLKPGQPAMVQVASWNIERGFKLPEILNVLTPNSSLPSDMTPQNSLKQRATQLEEQTWLAASNVFLFSEVDDGMKRTQYQNIALQLAQHRHLNAVYAVEFLELTPLSKVALEASQHYKTDDKGLGESLNVDPARYKGLHGSAILSEYPILKSEVLRLPQCYDWYKGEKQKLSPLEKTRRKAANTVFEETILTEVRKGGRLALIADLSVPQLPGGKMTVIETHLENRAPPACRRAQMVFLLNHIKNISNPVVIGGDWNTTDSDVSPTSVHHEIGSRAKDPNFIAKRILEVTTSIGFVEDLFSDMIQYFRNYDNPPAHNIPVVSPNHEHALFHMLKTFRFDDGTAFDLRGDHAHAYNRTDGFMANSNQRGHKGFVPTFSFQRPLVKGLFGKYKLDWFVVKAYNHDPLASHQGYQFAPMRARTLTRINHIYPQALSDHDPITVSMPLPMANGLQPTVTLTKGSL